MAIEQITVKNVLVGLTAILIGIFIFRFIDPFDAISNRSSESNARVGELLGDRGSAITPGALLGEITGKVENRITADEILYYTNEERVKYGLPKLTSQNSLAYSANVKNEDMIELDYFEHVNPEGRGLEYFIAKGGYEYIVVGENLAMGNWNTAEGVVTAWMNSEGHRANILSEKFSDIGISVVYTVVDGKDVLMATQHFGTSTKSCPSVDEGLKASIDKDTKYLESLEADIDELVALIDSNKASNSEIDEYNDLASEYNKLSADLASDISIYNTSVKDFNNCADLYR